VRTVDAMTVFPREKRGEDLYTVFYTGFAEQIPDDVYWINWDRQPVVKFDGERVEVFTDLIVRFSHAVNVVMTAVSYYPDDSGNISRVEFTTNHPTGP
jgi:hypothetical protein